MSKNTAYDVIIIGGGHNGLVCACYLAGAGLKVRVLEKRAIIGGAALVYFAYPKKDREGELLAEYHKADTQ